MLRTFNPFEGQPHQVLVAAPPEARIEMSQDGQFLANGKPVLRFTFMRGREGEKPRFFAHPVSYDASTFRLVYENHEIPPMGNSIWTSGQTILLEVRAELTGYLTIAVEIIIHGLIMRLLTGEEQNRIVLRCAIEPAICIAFGWCDAGSIPSAAVQAKQLPLAYAAYEVLSELPPAVEITSMSAREAANRLLRTPGIHALEAAHILAREGYTASTAEAALAGRGFTVARTGQVLVVEEFPYGQGLSVVVYFPR